MSARPRTVSDAEILEATGRAIARLGPARFTLADVAGDVGLSPATLVQRFGSKRRLLLALAGTAVEYVDACFEMIRAEHPAPLDSLLAAATHMAAGVESPESLANQLAFLQLDLSDPEFHRLALASHERVIEGYRALLDDAVEAGQLADCDTARLARAVGSLAGGSLIAWAIAREGEVVAYVREDLETLLAPYRRRGRRRRRDRPRRGRRGPATPRPRR